MDKSASCSQIGADDFARRFSMRAANLMWLLGAGSSAAAGIPTAQDMVWDFKQKLFISQRRATPKAVADLSSPVVRAQLQAHVDSLGSLPSPGAADEYAAMFEAVYPAEQDRRAYLDGKIAGAKPSLGHIALASLMRASRARLVWTTNFDALLADACARVYGTTGSLTTVALDAPGLATQLIGDERWPIEIKLHGDFRSRRLKNTDDELRQQDSRLRQVFVQCCSRFGLVVTGYSGRDNSVMEAIEQALERAEAFPAGLFWLYRSSSPPLERVAELMQRAAGAGVNAAFVEVENFDEALRDLMRMMSDVDTQELDAFAAERRRWSRAPVLSGPRSWPVVRLNALPVVQAPNLCRRAVCRIGGYAEVREAFKSAGIKALFARTSAGVLAYGADKDVRAALEPYGLSGFDLHTIETRRLRYDSGERGLLRDALTSALVRVRGLESVRRRRTDLLTPEDPRKAIWAPLRQLVGRIDGSVTGHPDLRWREGIATRLEWADDHLWLLIEPRTVFYGLNETNHAAAADFARERAVKRYNKQLNELISFWAGRAAGQGDDLNALGLSDGVDATFRLSSRTAFSRRVAG